MIDWQIFVFLNVAVPLKFIQIFAESCIARKASGNIEYLLNFWHTT